MINISKSLPNCLITEDLLMQFLLEHAQTAPTLDYAVLIEIRKTGYINSGELARKLNDLGFTQLKITQRAIDLMYDLKKCPKERRRPRKIVGYLIDFKQDSRNLTRSFASYTGYAWGSGQHISKPPAEKTLALPFDVPETQNVMNERNIVKIKAEFDKYRSWNNKIDWDAAQTQFMDKFGHAFGFKIKSEEEIVDWVIKALHEGKLPASPNKIAKTVNFELRWLRANPRAMRKTFNMEYTPSNILLAIKRKAGKPLKQIIADGCILETKPVKDLCNTPLEPEQPVVTHVKPREAETQHTPVPKEEKKLGKLKTFSIRELTPEETNGTNTAYYRIAIEVDLEISTLEAHEIINQITR